MKTVSLLLAALLTLGASTATLAEGMVYQKDELTVNLLSSDCTHELLAAVISSQIPGQVKDAVVTYQGTQIAACWVLVQDAVAIMDEQGHSGFLAIDQFVPAR